MAFKIYLAGTEPNFARRRPLFWALLTTLSGIDGRCPYLRLSTGFRWRPRRFIIGTPGGDPDARFSPQSYVDPSSPSKATSHGGSAKRSFTTKDGTSIFYKDWGSGRPIVFSHGWPLTSDAWDAQMLFLGMHGYRVIAHDRRGHGRSGQTWEGNEMDTYASDVASLFE